MGRMSTTLGAPAASVLLMLAIPASAQAANGTLTINGTAHSNPDDCFNAAAPLSIKNGTDKTAHVFSGADCTGQAMTTVAPGASKSNVRGASVAI